MFPVEETLVYVVFGVGVVRKGNLPERHSVLRFGLQGFTMRVDDALAAKHPVGQSVRQLISPVTVLLLYCYCTVTNCTAVIIIIIIIII